MNKRKFEYKAIPMMKLGITNGSNINIEKFNELGGEGWECIGIIGRGEVLFKRKIY